MLDINENYWCLSKIMDFNHDKDNYFELNKIDDRVQLHKGNCAGNISTCSLTIILFFPAIWLADVCSIHVLVILFRCVNAQ